MGHGLPAFVFRPPLYALRFSPSSVFQPWYLAVRLFYALEAFSGQHAFFLTPGAAAFLAADFFNCLLPDALLPALTRFQAITEFAPGQKPVLFTGAGLAAFHLQPRGAMAQVDTGRGFVYLLSALTGTQDEFFLQFRFPDAEGQHPCRKHVLFCLTDG